jgi:hypothetical protein
MATRKQVSANRENGLKGGVKTEEGKAISRLNARKHGIFAVALTPEDSEEVYGTEDELIASLRPVGRVEEMLVEKLALTYLRMQRCARAEAELEVYVKTWRMVELIGLYDGRLTNQFLKLLHEIQRQQRLRAAANDRAPESVPLRESSRAITEEEPAGLPAARLAGEDEPVGKPRGKPAGAEERGSDRTPQPAGADPAPESAAARRSSPLPQPPPVADDAHIPAEAGTASHLERVGR